MKALFQKICEVIHAGQPVALATIVATKGSLPMSKRAKMLVFQDGSILGTVGGGMLEATVIQEARHVLHAGSPKMLAIDLTSDQIEAEGLTCGGTVEILVECFSPEMPHAVMQEIADISAAAQSAMMATLLDEPISRKMVIRADGTSVGTFGNAVIDREILRRAQPHIGQEYVETRTVEIAGQPPMRVFFETMLPHPTAYVFGGGHVSLFLSKILHFIGFDFVVIDDREQFANAARFPEAKACIAHDFAGVFERLALDPHSSYIIILTRGHASDMIVLEQALRANVKYIGMIGSKRKVKLFMEHLQEHGVSQTQLEKIHAPIGMEIGADTPEEIAISIAAELIRIRRGIQKEGR